MKIHQLLSGVTIAVTNEENRFIQQYNTDIKITSLDEYDQWLAQNLVRKGVYEISNDNHTLIKIINETNS